MSNSLCQWLTTLEISAGVLYNGIWKFLGFCYERIHWSFIKYDYSVSLHYCADHVDTTVYVRCKLTCFDCNKTLNIFFWIRICCYVVWKVDNFTVLFLCFSIIFFCVSFFSLILFLLFILLLHCNVLLYRKWGFRFRILCCTLLSSFFICFVSSSSKFVVSHSDDAFKKTRFGPNIPTQWERESAQYNWPRISVLTLQWKYTIII